MSIFFIMKRLLLSYLFICLFAQISMAQLPDIKAMSTINIDAMSDAQLEEYLQKSQLSGLSPEELEVKGRERGLTDSQISQLKQRVAQLPSSKKTGAISASEYQSRKSVSNSLPTAKAASAGLPIFGAEFFTNTNLTFEPNMRLATPGNYVLGVDDELIIDVYGFSEKTTKVKLNTEGQIRLPNIGPVSLAGLTIDDAKLKLKQVMQKIYPGLATGKTMLQLGLGQIRTIRVIMIGEIKSPGTYSVSSLATIANALYLSGGPSANGSFRKINLIRQGKKLVQFDLYDFLLNGDLRNNILLKEDDIIKVEPIQIRVSIAGAVKKPAIYECLTGDCLRDIIYGYAGGFTDQANKQKISIERIGDTSRTMVDVTLDQIDLQKVKSSDYITVGTILDKYDNRVKIGGAVYFPGSYSLEKNTALVSLLKNARLKENAFVNRALLYRVNEMGETTVKAVNIRELLAGKENIALRNNDSLQVFTKSQLEQASTVTITGEVNSPGIFPYSQGILLEDIILLGGGLTDRASLKEVELLRRIRRDTSMADTSVYNSIFKFNLSDSLVLKTTSLAIALEPYDIVNVKNLPRNKGVGSVTIKGEVLFPGTYQLNTKNDRVSDLVRRAGGVLTSGSIASAVFLRNVFPYSIDATILDIKKQLVAKQVQDSISEKKLIGTIDSSKQLLAFNLSSALANPYSAQDILLEEGDLIQVPKAPTTVQVFGAVSIEKKIVYQPGMGVRELIGESGGFTDAANKNALYILYPNGRVSTTKKFLFFPRAYPRLLAGAEVYVPERKRKKALSTGELLGIGSSVVGIATLVFAIINSTK
ncbi:MAG: hypothetical protein EAZ35_11490 [Sphingobacteriia bacterium]|nr:MAG: hypothetical protein EAZ35_11490 [Sphingobacteriia bacterium]